MKRLVSVIIPAYNCEKTIKQCVESVLKQTYSNIEIIIVNDGSTDNTSSILKSMAQKDSRIKNVDQVNQGPGAARNKGMDIAKGYYFSFVDSDDIVHIDYIEEMVNVAVKEDLDLVFCNMTTQGKEKTSKSLDYNTIIGRDEVNRQIVNLIKQGKLNSPFAKIYKKDIQQKNNIYMPIEIDIGEDLQFNLEYIQNVNSFGLLNSSLYIYCTENSTLTKKFRKNEYDVRVNNIKKLDLFLKKNNVEDKQFIDFLYLKLMYAECMNMRRNISKEERLERINVILQKKEIDNAIDDLNPQGVLQLIMKYGSISRKAQLIDRVASLFNIGKKIGGRVMRASV